MHELGEAARVFVYLKVFEALFGMIMLFAFVLFGYKFFCGYNDK